MTRRYVCQTCGLAGPMAYFQGECRPGLTHSRLWPIEADPQCEHAIDALAELVRLKDGPRDDSYRAEKDAAWEAARRALRETDGPKESRSDA